MTLDTSELLSARILVVDDMPANVELLCQMLDGEGYTAVTGITNPREVGPLHRHEPYDLILLDLQMPGMDGFEVMAELQQHEPSGYLPVLVVTAQPSQKLRALQAGGRDFVSKPFDVLEIKTRIHNMLEVRLLYKRIEGDNRVLEQAVALRTAELLESEARFRALVELASDWYWEQDENGVFTKVSGPALEMLGLGDATSGDATPGEGADAEARAEAQPRWNPEDRAQLDEKLAMRRPFLDFVYRRVNADGSEQFLQTSGEPKFDPTGRFTGYRGIGMDVTGRMRAPIPAAQGLQRFRRALDATRDAVLLLDRATMRYVDANAAACRLSGYSRDELLALGPADLAADAGAAAGILALFDALIAGTAAGAATRTGLRRKDGAIVELEARREAASTDEGWTLVETWREPATLPTPGDA